jgi:hypothetical protein
MQPIQPAQRVERPPPPVSPPLSIDSHDDDDESDATTESSYAMSQQFPMLSWPSPVTPRSGRESPIPLPRGVSPTWSQQPTLTPESSLTAWSGAFVIHNFGHGSGSNHNGVGASWASAPRDMATFNLLRANSGRAASREANPGGGGSGRHRMSANGGIGSSSTNNNNGNNKPTNPALTEANIDFLRGMPSGGPSRRGPRATPQQNSGRPPKAQYTSNNPPHAAGVTAAAVGTRQGGAPPLGTATLAAAALKKQRPNDPTFSPPQQSAANVSPVRMSDRAKGLIGAAIAAKDSLSNVDAVAAMPQLSPSSAGEGHGTALRPDGVKGAATADKTSVEAVSTKGLQHHPATRVPDTAARPSQAPPQPLSAPPVGNNTAAPPAKQSPSASSRGERAPGEGTTTTSGRPRRTLSRHQAQVLPAEMTEADTPDTAPAPTALPQASTPPPPIPSPTCAAAGKRRPATSGRRPTEATATPTVITTTSTAAAAKVSAGLSAIAAAGASAATRTGPTPAPAKRAATAASKTVPGAPSEYISGGRLVQAARRIAVSSLVDAPLSKAVTTSTTAAAAAFNAVPKACERQFPLAGTLPKTKSEGVKSPAPAAASGSATEANKAANHKSSDQGKAGRDDPLAPDMGSLVSCSVHTIPPAKARELRVTQPPPPPPPPQPTEESGIENVEAVRERGAPTDGKTAPDASDGKGGAAAPQQKPSMERIAAVAAVPAPTGTDKVKDSAATDGRITPILTVEVARLTSGPPNGSHRPVKRAGRSPVRTTATAATKPTPPLSNISSTGASSPIALSKQPPAPVTQLTAATTTTTTVSTTAVLNANDTPKRVPPAAQSASPHDSEDSLPGPSTPTRSQRSSNNNGGHKNTNSGGRSRGSVTGSRSSDNTSREWNENLSSECPASVGSTQPPLSVRLPTSPQQQWPQPTNWRSSSATTSEKGEHEMSFASTLSASGHNSAVENLANTAGQNTPANRPKIRPPQPPFSLDGVTSSELARRERATGDIAASPSVRGLRSSSIKAAAGGCDGDVSSAIAAAVGGAVPVSSSPPASIPPNAALRARRSSHVVNSSVERISLADRRLSAPAQVERRSNPDQPRTSPPQASTGGTAATARRTQSGEGEGKQTPTDSSSITMVVGGRQLPRMFPSIEEVGSTVGKPTQATTHSATVGPVVGGDVAATDADKTTAFLANRRRAHSLPAGMKAQGSEGTAETPADASGGGGLRQSPAVGRGFNVARSTDAERGVLGELLQRPGSHLHGDHNGTATQRRRPPSSKGSNHAGSLHAEKDGDNAGGAVRASVLSPGSRGEAREAAFQPSPLRLPALTRFPRMPTEATGTDNPSTVPAPRHAHFSIDTDDVRQESSGSGLANSRDTATLLLSGRRRPSVRMPDDGVGAMCDSNMSSLNTNNRADTGHSEGSTNGDTPDITVSTRSFHKKAPQLRQRAPSMHLV